MPKYDPLREFLSGLPKGQKQVTLGFRRLEELLGDPLPPSALEYEQWWRGGRVKRGRIDANWQDQVQQRAWEDAGSGGRPTTAAATRSASFSTPSRSSA